MRYCVIAVIFLFLLTGTGCTGIAAIAFAVKSTADSGMLSKEELDALKLINQDDVNLGIARLERILEGYKNSGRWKDSQRVRSFLGPAYIKVGRIEDAEGLGKVLASDIKFRDSGLQILSSARKARGDMVTAEILDKEAAELMKKRYGLILKLAGAQDHEEVGINDVDTMRIKGESFMKAGLYADAEQTLRAALVESRQQSPQNPAERPDVLTWSILLSLAKVLMHLDRINEADEILREADKMATGLGIGAEEVNIGWRLKYAKELLSNNKLEQALIHISQASAIYVEKIQLEASDQATALGNVQDSGREILALHAVLVERVARFRNKPTDIKTIFRLIQFAHRSAAGEAALRSAVRLGSSNLEFKTLANRREKGIEEWRTIEDRILQAALNAHDAKELASIDTWRRQQATLKNTISGIEAEIIRLMPRFADLSELRILSLDELQKLLDPDQAVLLFLIEGDTSLVVAVNREESQVSLVAKNADDVAQSVRTLRSTLDPTGLFSRTEIPSFNVEEAYNLYLNFIKPVASILRGKHHVFVVPDGPLSSLPLTVLLTEAVKAKPTSLAEHRHLPWLARRHAFSTLPSASTFRALRHEAGRSQATQPFLGIGAPNLHTHRIKGLPPLAPLPEAKKELLAMAKLIGADASQLLLGNEATEKKLIAANPGNARVLVFATHALDSDDAGLGSEPALVLTPETEDGLLTASEIAALRLDADWVVLSACNTATGGAHSTNDVLSGLARAFLLSGTRSLLVSHWPVVADAAAELTPFLIGEVTTGKSQAFALQAAMMRLLDGDADPDFSHPLFWAPFVIVD